jgi:hypothetical protein
MDRQTSTPADVEDDTDLRGSYTEDAMMCETNLAIEETLREEMKKKQ